MKQSSVLLVLVLAGALLAASTVAAAGLSGELRTRQDLALDGQVNATAPLGVAHLRSDAVNESFTRLSADTVEVAYVWESGERVGRDGRDAIVESSTDWGDETQTFDHVTANVSRDQATPEVLVIATDGISNLAGRASGATQGRMVEDTTLTYVGDSESYRGVGTESRVGFSYTVDGPWPAIDGLDSATVTGDFLLFINNVTLTLSPQDEDQWDHWTGYRVSPGPTPGAQSFEKRVTVLRVTNGTLWVAGQDAVSLLGPRLDTSVQGSVTSSQVDGQLIAQDRSFLFDEAGLELHGTGTATLTGLQGQGQMEGFVSSSPQPALGVALDGAFDVEPSPGVQVTRIADPGVTGADLLQWGLGLGALVLAGAIAVGTRDRVMCFYTERKADRRREREERWRRAGDKAFEAREYEDALSWYQRIIEAYPNSLDGWNSLASTLEELERYDEAADAYETTAGMMEQDAHLLARGAGCAWRAGQDDRAVDLAVTVARTDPGVLRRQLDGAGLRGLREHETVRKALGEDRGGAEASYV